MQGIVNIAWYEIIQGKINLGPVVQTTGEMEGKELPMGILAGINILISITYDINYCEKLVKLKSLPYEPNGICNCS